MPQLTIQLTPRNPGGQIFRISLSPDEDATPSEHEQQHRRLVSALLPRLDLDGAGAPRVVVERERPAAEPMMESSGDDGGYEVIDLG
jgi:hypothetical protein